MRQSNHLPRRTLLYCESIATYQCKELVGKQKHTTKLSERRTHSLSWAITQAFSYVPFSVNGLRSVVNTERAFVHLNVAWTQIAPSTMRKTA